ncbi:MFS transporter [Paraburkholderia sediminicola]|uniref:hypothetical protein n=1 Tax=Paraburkholderia sediminicola TaxID=458836 RepID=UPI0038B785F1
MPLIFRRLFFQALDPVAGAIMALSARAAGVCARFLGSQSVDHYGTTRDRKFTLMLTLVMMGGASALVDCPPGHAVSGIWFASSLVPLHVVQSIILAGATLNIVDNVPQQHRCLSGPLSPIGNSFGILLSFGAMTLVSKISGPHFAPSERHTLFLLTMMLVAIVLAGRSRALEPPTRAKQERHGNDPTIPPLELVTNHSEQILITFVVRLGALAGRTAVVTSSYAATTLHNSKTPFLTTIVDALALAMVTTPPVGLASDGIDRKHLIFPGTATVVPFSLSYFALLQTFNPVWVPFTIVIWWSVFTLLIYATESAVFAKSFEARMRCGGINLSKQPSDSASVGLCPVMATSALQDTTGAQWRTIAFLILMVLSVVAATTGSTETRHIDLQQAGDLPRQVHVSLQETLP